MMGIWANHSGDFLSIVGWFLIATTAIPFTLWPLASAKLIGWEIPEKTDLATYFGRSLGCLAGAVALFSLRAADSAPVQPPFFVFLLTIWIALLLLHVYGAIRRSQPLIETLEIGFWLGLTLLTLACWPTVPT
jgi:hypothetical protein